MKGRESINLLREFVKIATLSLPILLLVPPSAAAEGSSGGARDAIRQPLPAPVINPHSTEICMNSRLSYHAGWSGAATDQMLANVLHATAQAPVTGATRVIYVATPQNVYVYDAAGNSLVLQRAGDWRSDASTAFQVGVATDRTVDAGAAMHLSQLESIALWTGTAGQLASCPRASDTTYANSHWNPAQPIDIVISFGMRNVAGLTSTLVAISSDGSLPNPQTDGPVYMDTALQHLAYDTTFAATTLTLANVSQILWGTYGCSNHTASGKAGLVCSSAVANYYLTRHIYSISADAVYRFHNRRPPGTDATTRDHRIELVRNGDTRPGLRQGTSGLPNAPNYLVICVASTGDWPELEVGFAAMGAVLAASTIGLQGYVTAGLTAGEQAAIRTATGIPSNDIPIAVVSLGQPSDASSVEGQGKGNEALTLVIENQVASSGRVAIRYGIPAEDIVHLAIYDCLGHKVRDLIDGRQRIGGHAAAWDCQDERGRPVQSGVYFCRLTAGGLTRGAQVVVIR